MNEPTQRPPPPAVVTLAALYGAGGSVVGPKVAERLGVQFLDRAIPSSVAGWAGVPEKAVADVDQKPRSGWDQLLAILGRASPPTGASDQVEHLDLEERPQTAAQKVKANDRARREYVRSTWNRRPPGCDPRVLSVTERLRHPRSSTTG